MSPNDPQPARRSFDERMDALSMHVELHAAMMRDFDLRMEEEAQKRRETDARIDKLIKVVEIDAENIRALVRIAEAHQDRIETLEGDPPAR